MEFKRTLLCRSLLFDFISNSVVCPPEEKEQRFSLLDQDEIFKMFLIQCMIL